MHLPIGYFLCNGTYRIERVLGQGGFGITYLAFDMSLQRWVAIKEFFPADFCNRDSSTSHVTVGTQTNVEFISSLKAKFLKEARNIAGLSHPNIIRILAAFEENGTAYYVMDYIEGHSLADIITAHGPLSPDRAVFYITRVGGALEYLHSRNMMHLDVKPANIMLRFHDDTPILIDFGLSKRYDGHGNQTSTTPTGISHGFAPIEQYSDGGISTFSPQTDLYSLAATLYFLATGEVLPAATERYDREIVFPPYFPQGLIPPMCRALELSRRNRHESVRNFLYEISNVPLHAPFYHRSAQAATEAAPIANPDISSSSGYDSIQPPPPNGPQFQPEEASPEYSDEEYEYEGGNKGVNKVVLIVAAVIGIALIGTIVWFATRNSEENNNYPYIDYFDENDTVPVAVEAIAEVVDTLDVDALPAEANVEPGTITEIEIVDVVDRDNRLETGSYNNDDATSLNSQNSTDLWKEAVIKDVVETKPANNEPKQKNDSPVNMAMVEQKPTFPGGDSEMYRWIARNLTYPPAAAEEGVSGTVSVQFIVEKDGSLTGFTIARGKHPALDAEAIRVLKKMPKWNPGRVNGAPVRVTYMLPVRFQLQ